MDASGDESDAVATLWQQKTLTKKIYIIFDGSNGINNNC